MSKLYEFNKSLIEPIYSQSHPSQPIELGTFTVQIKHQNKTFQESATVTMQFMPKERLCFVTPILRHNFFGRDDENISLTFTDREIAIDVFCVSATSRSKTCGELVFVPKTSIVTITPPSKTISSATFHVFNFPDFLGPEDYSLTWGEPLRKGYKRCRRVILKAEGWSITIAATDKTDDLTKDLKTQGGYVITHMARIEREDGSMFSSEQLDDMLHCAHYFLSFALGRWAGVALPIGFDKAGKRVFEQWGLPMAAAGPWGGSCSWFDAGHEEMLSQVFPGFIILWKNELWHRALTEGLYWYLGACERGTGIGVDTGLILAQTALELLAWIYCVQHRKMISEKAFGPRGLSAADKLRILASSLDIPLEIPDCLNALHAKRGEKWQDGMDAITGIRNAIVHPSAQNPFPGGSYLEAWKLSLWYIDMVLLRLCGHVGQYSNRLVNNRCMGELEGVPWAENRTDKVDK